VACRSRLVGDAERIRRRLENDQAAIEPLPGRYSIWRGTDLRFLANETRRFKSSARDAFASVPKVKLVSLGSSSLLTTVRLVRIRSASSVLVTRSRSIQVMSGMIGLL
jgi:hypothetical protein